MTPRPHAVQLAGNQPVRPLAVLLDRQGAKILRAIVLKEPGCTMRLALHQSGLARGRLQAALEELAASGQVVAFRAGTSLHLFPALPGLEECWMQFMALRDAQRARLYNWLVEQGACSRARLFEHAGKEWRWPAPTTKLRLMLLIQQDLVATSAGLACDRRLAWLKPKDPAPVVQSLLQTLHGGLPMVSPLASGQAFSSPIAC